MRMRTGQAYVKNVGRVQHGLRKQLEEAESVVQELAMKASCRKDQLPTNEMRLAVGYVERLREKIEKIYAEERT